MSGIPIHIYCEVLKAAEKLELTLAVLTRTDVQSALSRLLHSKQLPALVSNTKITLSDILPHVSNHHEAVYYLQIIQTFDNALQLDDTAHLNSWIRLAKAISRPTNITRLESARHVLDTINAWRKSDDTGQSSLVLAQLLEATYQNTSIEQVVEEYANYLPLDADDFGRCHRLSQLVPNELVTNLLNKLAQLPNKWGKFAQSWYNLDKLYVAKDYQAVYNILSTL